MGVGSGSGRVLVVGGGITGLAATHELTRLGSAVTLVEASPRLGGKIRTVREGDFLVEDGPDSFVSFRPAGLQLVRELGLGDDVIRTTDPRVVHIRVDGRMVPMPEGMGLILPTKVRPFVTTRLLTWPQKLRAGLDLVLPRWLDAEDVSIGAFVRHRLGPAMVERLADPLLGGIYGAPVDELSLTAVVPQLAAYEREHRSLLLASLSQARAARSGPGPRQGSGQRSGSGSGSPFVSLSGGMGSLVDALVAAIREAPGSDVRTGARVVSLDSGGPRTVALLSDGTRLAVDAVVLAGPARESARLVRDSLPEAAAAIDTIPHGSTAVVTLGYAPSALTRPLAGHGFLVAGGEPLCFGACTFSSSKWAGRAPDGAALLRVFVPDRQAALLSRTDDDVARAVHTDLAPVLGLRGIPVVRRVARWTGAMPRYAVGHLERVSAIERAMATRPDLVLAGAAFRGVGVPECIAKGREAAASAVGGALSGGA